MSDDTEKSEEEAGPVGGELLKAARRANDISVRDVAKALHLDEAKVRALEKNEFDVLGAPVFAKGHLRKYAQLVGVPIDDIMADYYLMNRATGAPPVVGPVRKHARDFNAGPWLGGAVIVVLVAAALYWWFVLRSVEPAGRIEPAANPPVTTESAETPAAGSEPGLLPAEVDAGPEPEIIAAPVDEMPPATSEPESALPIESAERAEPDSAPVSTEPQVEIELAYAGDCWTEVSDASGRRLFYDLGREGRVITLSGDAPLRVILGDSNNVSIRVEGRDWPIPAAARSGRLARLTIDAQ